MFNYVRLFYGNAPRHRSHWKQVVRHGPSRDDSLPRRKTREKRDYPAATRTFHPPGCRPSRKSERRIRISCARTLAARECGVSAAETDDKGKPYLDSGSPLTETPSSHRAHPNCSRRVPLRSRVPSTLSGPLCVAPPLTPSSSDRRLDVLALAGAGQSDGAAVVTPTRPYATTTTTTDP